MRYSFVFVLLLSLSAACTQNQVSTEQQPEQASATPPVYRSFEELAPLFEQQNDTTYVINFWATWCKPCVEELPYFEQLHNRYGGQKVKVVLVSLDFENQIEKKLLPFLAKHQLQSEVRVLVDGDANGWIPKIDESWSGAIPATLFYRNAERQFEERQFDDFDDLNNIVKTFIKS